MVRERKKAGGGGKPPGDFKRRTAKVGKRAVAPMTATSTKFSSKRIAMPEQSVLKDRDDDAPTAAQGRELKLLLVQIKHYAPGVRTEAAKGLTHLVSKHKSLVMKNLRCLILAAAERFGDSEDSPRAAGQELLQQLVSTISEVSNGRIGPFEMLLIAHLGSALTSLERSVRFDGLVSVSIILGQNPGIDCTLGPSWLSTLLPCLVDVLKGTGTGLRLAAGGGRVLVKAPKSKSGAKIGSRLKCLRALVSLLTSSTPPNADLESEKENSQSLGLYRTSASIITASSLYSSSLLSNRSEDRSSHITDMLWADLIQGLRNAWTEAYMSANSTNDTRLEVSAMEECAMIAESVSLVVSHWGSVKLVSVLNDHGNLLGRVFTNLVGVIASSRLFPFTTNPNRSAETAAALDQTIVDTVIKCAVMTSVLVVESDMQDEEEEEEEEDDEEDDDSALTMVTATRSVVSYLRSKLADPLAAVNNVALLKNLSSLLLSAPSLSPKLHLERGCGRLKKSTNIDKLHIVDLTQLRQSFDCLSGSVMGDAVASKKRSSQGRVGLSNLSSTVSWLLISELESEKDCLLSEPSLIWANHLPGFLFTLSQLMKDKSNENASPYYEAIMNILKCLTMVVDRYLSRQPKSDVLTQLSTELAPFYTTIWPNLDQQNCKFGGSVWGSGLCLLSSCASAGALAPESVLSESIGNILPQLTIQALRITLEVLHHNRQQMKPDYFLSILLSVADHAVITSEESVEKLMVKKSMALVEEREDWNGLEVADGQVAEVCRALKLAGGCKLLKPLMPQLQGWLKVDMEDAEVCWVRPRVALQILLTLAHPAPGQEPDFQPILDMLVESVITLFCLPLPFDESRRRGLLTSALDILDASPIIKPYFLAKCCSHFLSEEKDAEVALLSALQWVVKQPSSLQYATEWPLVVSSLAKSSEATTNHVRKATQDLIQDISLFCGGNRM